MSRRAAPSECSWTFSGVSIVFVFCVRIFCACNTLAGRTTFGFSYIRSILKDCFPIISFAVFQLTCLKPRRAVTIWRVFSTRMLGFDIDRSSRMAAFVRALSASLISFSASFISSVPKDDLKSERICSSILSAVPAPGPAPWIAF